MTAKTILIVEDELDMRIFLKTAMETSGFRPVLARNAAEGMERIAAHRPDLVLLDVMMPGEGGVTMYRHLKTDALLCDIPVVILSAVAEDTYGHYLNMLNLKFDGKIPKPDAYLEKPPDPDELVRTVTDLMR